MTEGFSFAAVNFERGVAGVGTGGRLLTLYVSVECQELPPFSLISLKCSSHCFPDIGNQYRKSMVDKSPDKMPLQYRFNPDSRRDNRSLQDRDSIIDLRFASDLESCRHTA